MNNVHRLTDAYTVRFVQDKLTAASSIANQLPSDWPLSYIDKQRCNDISLKILYAEKALRTAYEGQINGDSHDDAGKARIELAIPQDICLVERPPNAILSITLPIILNKGRSEWYSSGYRKRHATEAHLLDNELEFIVTTQLQNNIRQNGSFDVPAETLFVVFRRFIPARLDTAKVMYVDNNNVETGAVTNAISRTLGKGDNYHNMSFVYIAIPSEQRKIEVILCRFDQLMQWIKPFKNDG